VRITEIFHSIQGESSHAGRPCVFVRLTGCNLRCRWCDSEYTFTGGEKKSLDDVIAQVKSYGTRLVEITGGEPLAQQEAFELIRRLCDDGFEVLIETSGSIDITPVDKRAKIILDVKCPGSGEVAKNRWENIDELRPHDEVKFVIADRNDYEWAKQVIDDKKLERQEQTCQSERDGPQHKQRRTSRQATRRSAVAANPTHVVDSEVSLSCDIVSRFEPDF